MPRPRRISRIPPVARMRIASRSVVRLTFSSSDKIFSLGSLLPGKKRFSTVIMDKMLSAIRSDNLLSCSISFSDPFLILSVSFSESLLILCASFSGSAPFPVLYASFSGSESLLIWYASFLEALLFLSACLWLCMVKSIQDARGFYKPAIEKTELIDWISHSRSEF